MAEYKTETVVEKTPGGRLTDKDLTRLGLRSTFLQASFNFERMQAGGWTWAIAPFLEKIHGKKTKKLKDSLKDNLEFLNTTPVTVGFLMGMVLSLEEHGEPREVINNIKRALFGPLAGIGDAIFWFTLLPIIAGVSGSMAINGNILGPLLFFVAYVGVFFSRIFWTKMGYKLGRQGLAKIKAQSKIISHCATILGVTVIGALIASYVNINVALSIPIAEGQALSLQEGFFDKILPNFLPLCYTFFMFYLLKKKNSKPTTLIFITFVGSILMSALGVL